MVGMVSAADQDLAKRYAPILYFEKNEKCYPIDISYALNNSYLYEVGNPIPISTAPTKAMLANYTTEKFYLDLGYDPVFIPEGFTKTFGEMQPEEKLAVSHRGRALRKLRAYLESLPCGS
jgi:hypothetical protein